MGEIEKMYRVKNDGGGEEGKQKKKPSYMSVVH